MATNDSFSYEKVDEVCKKLSNKMESLCEYLKLADNLIRKNVNVDGDSAVLGNVGTQLISLWEENVISVNSLKDNLGQWVKLLLSISNSYQNFEDSNTGLKVDESTTSGESGSSGADDIVDMTIVNSLALQITNGTLNIYDLFNSDKYTALSNGEKNALEVQLTNWVLDADRAGQYCENGSYLDGLPDTFKNKVYARAADSFYDSTYAQMIKVGSHSMAYGIYHSVPQEVQKMINDKFFNENSTLGFGQTSKFVLPVEFGSYSDAEANRQTITYMYRGKVESTDGSFIIAKDIIPLDISNSLNYDYTQMDDYVVFVNKDGVAQSAKIKDSNGNMCDFTFDMLQQFQNGGADILKKYDFSQIYVGSTHAQTVRVNLLTEYSTEGFDLSSFDAAVRPLVITGR